MVSERRSDKMRLYNFDNIQAERQWLKEVLISNSSDSDDEKHEITESDLQYMLKMHVLHKKWAARYYLKADVCNSQQLLR